MVQEVMRKALEQEKKFKYNGEPAFRAWIARIARNVVVLTARPELRARAELTKQLAGTVLDPNRTPCTTAQQAEERARLAAALGRLESDDREVVVEKFIKDRNFAQCADDLGISRATAVRRLVHGMHDLRLALEE